jgi:hypothetical protein
VQDDLMDAAQAARDHAAVLRTYEASVVDAEIVTTAFARP